MVISKDINLSNFEQLCLEYIAKKNIKFEREIFSLMSNLKVLERQYGNPVGFYVYFEVVDTTKLDNQNMPVMLNADLELPEFNDWVSFMFYPNDNNDFQCIFIEAVSYVTNMNLDYIAQRMKSEMQEL